MKIQKPYTKRVCVQALCPGDVFSVDDTVMMYVGIITLNGYTGPCAVRLEDGSITHIEQNMICKPLQNATLLITEEQENG